MAEPKFLISKKVVLGQFDKVAGYSDIVSYSSKTNPLITAILEKERGCMFSVHLVNELKYIKDMSRVLFFAQGWQATEIRELLYKGIKWFVVDNESDLSIFISAINDFSNKVNLLLRMKLKENTVKTEKYFVFGMDSDVINEKIKELSNNNKIGQLGVHFHRKTQNMSEWSLKRELEDLLNKETLGAIDVVNIGGGLPSSYANTNTEVLQGIFKKIREFKEWLNSNNIKMMIEPGRFIAAPAGKLVTEIISIYGDNIIVNASVYNTDLDALIVPVKLLVEGELKTGKAYKIKGKTPCSLDLFRYKVYLKNPKVGDNLIFINAGAYNFSSTFCDLQTLQSVLADL